MRQTDCIVVNPIIVNICASLFGCTPAGRASDYDGYGLKALKSVGWCLVFWLWSAHRCLTGDFLWLQHFSYFLLSGSRRCFISVFVRFFSSRRCCTNEIETLHADKTNVLCKPRRGLWARKIDLTPPPPPPPPRVRFLLTVTVPRQCF